jgi:putative Ca2+/H+ antiporter (TMEM165/GDT1 family)
MRAVGRPAAARSVLRLADVRVRSRGTRLRPVPFPRAQSDLWVHGFVAIFIAEWGDLTQLATAALAAAERDPLGVGIGAVAALWTVCVLAAALARRLGAS